MAAPEIPQAAAVTVRPARPEDAAAIAAIHVTAWHEAYSGLLPPEMIAALTVEVRQAWWAQVLSSPEPGTDETVYLAIRGHGRLTEVAYGWRDLAPLAAAGSGARPGGG